VLFSSHILSEVQRICDRVAIIKEGRIINTQKISELQQNSYKKVLFTVKNAYKIGNFAVTGASNIQVQDNSVGFIFNGDCNLLLSEIGKYPLTNIDISEPSLDEIFMHYYSN
jgi:ABC-2 type transport system ATP-binding protein